MFVLPVIVDTNFRIMNYRLIVGTLYVALSRLLRDDDSVISFWLLHSIQEGYCGTSHCSQH